MGLAMTAIVVVGGCFLFGMWCGAVALWLGRGSDE